MNNKTHPITQMLTQLEKEIQERVKPFKVRIEAYPDSHPHRPAFWAFVDSPEGLQSCATYGDNPSELLGNIHERIKEMINDTSINIDAEIEKLKGKIAALEARKK